MTQQEVIEKFIASLDSTKLDSTSTKEKYIWQELHDFWIKESLKLIEKSYGCKFNDSDTK